MTSLRSLLGELTPTRPRVRAALAALLALALIVAVPYVHGESASAAKAQAAKKTRAKAKGKTRTRTGATSGRRATRRPDKKQTVEEPGTAKGPTLTENLQHKPAPGKAEEPPAGADEETKNRPAREKSTGSTTPSPAGGGAGGGERPKLPQPAHASQGAATPSSPAPSTQPTTSAGTVPTRPLPVAGSRRQRGSRRAAGPGSAARGARAIDGASAPLDAPRLLPLSRVGAAGSALSGATGRGERRERATDDGGGSPVEPVTRTVRDIVEVVPAPIQRLLLALAGLTTLLGIGYLLVAARARRLERQRGDLLQEVGLLQAALLPPVPSRLGAVAASVAYRPSDGPAAGGDFYDALMLSGGRAAFILGDVSGHGRPALARTAFMRYTLRAYLEAGLEPRIALQVAGRVVDEHLGGDFATVLVAVHDPSTGSLTYASAGHPAPLVLATIRTEPVLAASSPPIGLGMRTGLRQTTLPLPPGSLACLYTDGLTEARTEGGILGRPRLGDMIEDLGPDVTAVEVLDAVAAEARLVSDDMAAVLISPTAGVTAGGFRTEQLEIDASEADTGLVERFLEACGTGLPGMDTAVREVRQLCDQHGGAVMHVKFGIRGPQIEVVPRNVESLEAASRRALALAR